MNRRKKLLQENNRWCVGPTLGNLGVQAKEKINIQQKFSKERGVENDTRQCSSVYRSCNFRNDECIKETVYGIK